MKRSLAAVAAALCVAASAPAFAQGWYAGLTIGQGKADFNASDIGLSIGTIDDKDTTFGGRLGYDFNRNFGVEIGYYELGKYPFNGTVAGLPVSGEAKAKSYSASVVGTLPFSDQFSAYGKIGYARSRVEGKADVLGFSGSSSDWESEAVYGVGLKWMVDRQWGIFGEWMRNDDIKVDNYMIGALVRF